MEPEDQVIRYAEHDGASIAWSAVGRGAPLVIGGWWSSHLELDWRNARFRRFAAALARHRTVIRYDRPGAGVSDRGGIPARTLEEELATLETLIDEAAPGRVALFGASSGAGVASLYAARHPERVDALVLYGSYARGADLASPAARDAMLAVIAQHWGLGSRVLADLFLPDATADERAEFVEFQRRSASREVALASLRAVYAFDATGHLGDVLAPTLVLHRRHDRAIPFALGKDIARRIRNARFVELEGDDHFPWRGDADAVVRETLAFLGAPVDASGGRSRAGVVASAGAAVPTARLTEREREVLRLVAQGCTDGEIATRLMLSAHTVHRHVANIRLKLDVPSRTAAAAWALRHEVI
ncbi:alpha/beta fold hydrolase [Agromyces sp. CFH 90414]|uniref:Alpha/beta fold hydrolase n=1 Tax=Agromyces agglutinans TaxID=2662258 RepID=A0A6I2F8B8_9MICO|nr:alpha/beta fold hydrolase [Agromyces agglutinans]MRG61695.1 alpha/beta fold hydrolase [Agromyces agglutinans]